MGEIVDALRRASERNRKAIQLGAESASARDASESPIFHAPLAAPAMRRVPDAPTVAEAHTRDGLHVTELRSIAPAPISCEAVGNWTARSLLVRRAGPVAEGYRKFALRVHALLQQRKKKTVVVTGPLREEGKTTTACNLAFALASLACEEKIALVDLDLRRPSIAKRLDLQGIEARAGFEAVLRGSAKLTDCVVPTEITNLDLYLIAEPVQDAERLLSKKTFAHTLHELAQHYAAVVIDTPPVILVPDTALILAHADTFVAVSRAGQTRLRSIQEMFAVLPSTKLIGAFLNEAPTPNRVAGYDYGYYHGASSDAATQAQTQPRSANHGR